MKNEEQTYLGVDWGKAKIGLALAHPETGVVLSLGTIQNDSKALELLDSIIKREHVGTVIIGFPVRHRLSPSLAVRSAQLNEHPVVSYGRSMEERCGVRVEYHDEMFTTKMAQKRLIEAGKQGKIRYDDAEAARILLESWLSRSASQ